MRRTHGTKDFWVATLRAEGATLLAAVNAPGVLPAPVPSCPDWTVGELVRHVGAVYRRTRVNAGATASDTSWGPVVIPEDAPDPDNSAIVEWFANELAQIDAFLDALDPDVPAWNWAPQAKIAGFWHRRMAHETSIHRWDAQLGAGQLPEPLESKTASDVVNEALDTFLPAGRRIHPTDVSGLVHLVASDLDLDWYLRLRGDGVALLDTDTLFDDDAHPTRAQATGTASDLALALWGRVALDVLDTVGEISLLEALRIR